MQSTRQSIKIIAMLAVAGGLAACGTLSNNIANDGSGAEQLLWPEMDATGPLHTGGTWPEPDGLRQITSGMTKEQVMALLGPPHFSEGFVAVREWNYLFHLRNRQTQDAWVCQYKILFDTEMLARSFYWKPAGCAGLLELKPAPAAAAEEQKLTPPVAAAPPAALPLTVYFAYDKSGWDDIHGQGHARLHQITSALANRAASGQVIVLKGYAGPIAGDAYNRTLSEERANTVRNYLIQNGVPERLIRAEGHGSTDLKARCEKAPADDLAACYAPNRRVEITRG